MDQVTTLFSSLLARQGIVLNEHQFAQFEAYYRALIEWNERMNLTGITEREQVYVKHFYDSVSLSFFMPLTHVNRLIDIGSGAGFPSIPLKIIHPHLQITIVDSLNKRIQFLKYITSELNLTDVQCIHSRAEDAARMPLHRDQYDLATARAVARLNVLSELCLPFVRPGGHFIAMKGADAAGEIEEADYSMRALKAKFIADHAFELPVEQSARHILIMEKVAATPAAYPRKAGIPTKLPLIGR